MKKISMVLLGTFLLMFVTGCGDDVFTSLKKDTLTCTGSELSESEFLEETGRVREQFIFEFGRDGIVNRAYQKNMFIFDDKISSSKKQTAIEDTKKSCSGTNEGYVTGTCKVSWEEPNKLVLQYEVDLSWQDDLRGKTKDEIIKEAEENDYTCK